MTKYGGSSGVFGNFSPPLKFYSFSSSKSVFTVNNKEKIELMLEIKELFYILIRIKWRKIHVVNVPITSSPS